MGIGGAGRATGNPGGGYTRCGGIDAFVKIPDSCCRSCRLTAAMGASGLAGDGFSNALVISCATAIVRSADDGMGIVRVDGNQAMVSEFLSVLVALIHTL